MKKMYFDDSVIITGTAREIRSLVNQLWDRWDQFTPSHCDFPQFNPCRMYGVDLAPDGTFTVLNSDTLVKLFLA